MDTFLLSDYDQQMEEEKIILAFKGILCDQSLVGMVELIRTRLFEKQEKRSLIKNICLVFIELSQNICFYSARKPGKGIIMIQQYQTFYQITAGNLAENGNIPNLINKVRHINTLNPAELKAFYHKRLRMPLEEGRVGGNIGLILIARKSDYPIGLTISPVNDHQSFIEFSVTLNR